MAQLKHRWSLIALGRPFTSVRMDEAVFSNSCETLNPNLGFNIKLEHQETAMPKRELIGHDHTL